MVSLASRGSRLALGFLMVSQGVAVAEIVIPVPSPPPEKARSVVTRSTGLDVLMFNGDRLRFERSGDAYRRIEMRVGGRSYVLDLQDCQPFGPVHPETIELVQTVAQRATGDFRIKFVTGGERDRRFGDLPTVELEYMRGEPGTLRITRKTAEKSWFSDRLCRWRTPPEQAQWEASLAFRDTIAHGATLPTMELLRRYLAEPVFWKQMEIGKLLAARRDPAIVRELAPLLTSTDRHVRANAAYVIATQGDPRGLRTVLAILDDRSNRPCAQGLPMDPCTAERQRVADWYFAAHVLGLMRDPRAVPALAKLIGDPDVGYKVPWSLAQIGTPDTVAPIMRALDDPDPTVRVIAIESLQKLRAKEALPKLRKLQNDSQRSRVGELKQVGEAAREAVAVIEAAGVE